MFSKIYSLEKERERSISRCPTELCARGRFSREPADLECRDHAPGSGAASQDRACARVYKAEEKDFTGDAKTAQTAPLFPKSGHTDVGPAAGARHQRRGKSSMGVVVGSPHGARAKRTSTKDGPSGLIRKKEKGADRSERSAHDPDTRRRKAGAQGLPA